MQYRLRTLLIVLAIGPALLGWLHWVFEPEPPTPAMIFSSDSHWLLPWYAPGTPQSSALCKQTAERRLSPKTREAWQRKWGTERFNSLRQKDGSNT
jgi:hypothetical protein